MERRADIDWTLLVALESPQQMFFFGRFPGSVYFKLLRHSLEVKGLRMECVRRWERERRPAGEDDFCVAFWVKGQWG